MKSVRMHRKYAIQTNFLDTMLEQDTDIQKGETKLDAYRRGLKELDQIAADLRQEYESMRGQIIQETIWGARQEFPTIGPTMPQQVPIITKDFEKVEIAIDNAETVDELKKIKSDYPVVPIHILTHYNNRLQELSTERPTEFSEGLG